MHELIPRRQTVGSEGARALSFQPELCSILCPICHKTADENETKLWEANIKRYGRDQVLQALERLNAIWETKVNLPEDNNEPC